jgi:hypothetical protein
VSACTYIFLAGAKRELAEDAELGFHQASALGVVASDKKIIQDMVEYYRSAGLRESFIDHIVATPPDDMWYPTRRELENAGVIMPDRTVLVN